MLITEQESPCRWHVINTAIVNEEFRIVGNINKALYGAVFYGYLKGDLTAVAEGETFSEVFGKMENILHDRIIDQ